jgi:hypothetical protein
MDPDARKKLFFRIRVAVLLFILFVVVLYAIRDFRSRRARNEWDHTLAVAVVLIRDGDVDAASVEALRARAPALRDRLEAEMQRYRAGPAPFTFRVLGPIAGVSRAPEPQGDGPIDLGKQALALSSWLRDVDPKAGVNPDLFDSRIYVRIKPPTGDAREFVEGRSEENGRVGFVDVDLDAEMVDIALCVVAHELMHTLGATDRYDAAGRTLIPDGLGEPERVPLYPQRFFEVMARNRVVAPGHEQPPDTLDQLAVGRITAHEIGWQR